MQKFEATSKLNVKQLLMLSIFFVALQLAGCTDAPLPTVHYATPVAFAQYSRYSYGGPRASSDTTFFYVTTTKADFESLFFFIFDHNVPDTIPSADLSSKHVFSVVKYSNEFYDMQTVAVDLVEGVLRIHYTCDLVRANMTWHAAIPMIVTAKAEYTRVQFIENGVSICEIPRMTE